MGRERSGNGDVITNFGFGVQLLCHFIPTYEVLLFGIYKHLTDLLRVRSRILVTLTNSILTRDFSGKYDLDFFDSGTMWSSLTQSSNLAVNAQKRC